MSQILIKSKSCIGEQSSFVSLIRVGSQINIRIKENYRVGLHNSVFELGTFFGFINDFNQVNIYNTQGDHGGYLVPIYNRFMMLLHMVPEKGAGMVADMGADKKNEVDVCMKTKLMYARKRS